MMGFFFDMTKASRRQLNQNIFNPLILGIGCASSVYYNTLLYRIDIKSVLPLLFLGGFGTHLIYSIPIIFFFGETGDRDAKLKFNKAYWLLLFIDLLVILWSFAVLTLYVKMVLAALGTLCFLYFFGIESKFFFMKRFRDIPFMKTIIIPLIWVAMIVYLPMAQARQPFNSFYKNEMIRYFIFFFAVATTFDIKDRCVDIRSKLTTIPTYLGAPVSRIISIGGLLCYSFWTFTQYDFSAPFYTAVVASLWAAYHSVTIQPSEKKDYSINSLDAILIFQPVFFLFLEYIDFRLF
ncbi:MAG TPA: hypothetical protein VF691_19570 [Cytophagaceae bacterium]